MRLFKPALLASTLAMAAAAFAQADAPAEKAEQEQPLAGLKASIDTLQDEQAQPEEAAPQEAAPQEPAVAEPAPAPPPPPPPPPPPAAARPAGTTLPPLTRAQRAEIEASVARGQLLIAIARAGFIATQDMLTRLSDPASAGIVGWLAEPEGNGMAVNFFADGANGPVAVYRVSVLGGRVTSRQIFLGDDRPALSPVQARMAAARAVVAGLGHRPCTGEEFNYLIVPPTAAGGQVAVYQIAPVVSRGRVPLGGHRRTIVAADGSVVEARLFNEGCADLQVPAVAAGAAPSPLAVDHAGDALPGEIHLMLAQLAGRALRVTAGDPPRSWFVGNDRIVAAD